MLFASPFLPLPLGETKRKWGHLPPWDVNLSRRKYRKYRMAAKDSEKYRIE